MSVDKFKFWSIENKITPRNITKSSHKKFWFNCDQCAHDFKSRLGHITDGRWCAYCSHRKLCDDDCKFCFNNSFASSDKVHCWSEKNDLQPRDVFLNARKEFLFDCDNYKHEFNSKLCNVTKQHWCPYCSDPSKKLCKHICDDNCDDECNDDCDDSCKMCFNNSFASYTKAIYWSNKNKLKPRDVFKGSDKKYWFNCNVCPHDFYTALSDISNDIWCPYCAHHKLCDNNNCKMCFDNSFASSDKVKFWSIKNKKNPRFIFKCTDEKFFFDCNECNHEFSADLNNVKNGTWCPICKNKTEQLILEFLSLSKFVITREYKVDWCKNIKTDRHLPFDFFIFITLNNIIYYIIIEVDGSQHFKDNNYFQTNAEDNSDNDVYKMKKALENNHHIIRISQHDVWKNKIDWKKLLLESINKIPKNEVEYISKETSLYDNHKNKMSSIL
jgi:hypothetical protein